MYGKSRKPAICAKRFMLLSKVRTAAAAIAGNSGLVDCPIPRHTHRTIAQRFIAF
jgi:hypothetical protein